MKRILVTGSNGQLGNELKSLEANFPNFHFIFADRSTLDLSDSSTIQTFCQANTFDYCINAGAYTKVDLAEKEQELCQQINVNGVKTLAEICFQKGIPFLHFSSDYVFNGIGTEPYIETDLTDPRGVYAKSKEEGEKALIKLASNYQNSKFCIIRTSWVYSTFGHNFVKTMIRLMNERPEISVVNDQIGSPTYAKDLAVTALKAVLAWEEGKTLAPIYHFSNEGVCSWFDFARAIAEFIDYKGKVNPITTSQYPTPAPRPAYSVLNKSKVKAELDITIRSWEEALDECLQKLIAS